MKRIVCPSRVDNSMRSVLSVLLPLLGLIAGTDVKASLRPIRGGSLRVQMNTRIASIDPRQWPSDSAQVGAAERMESLVFDRLVRFDDHGVLQPALAVSWHLDAQSKRWQFLLRKGVKFSDGSPLTPEVAALALQQLLGNAFDVSPNSDSVIIQTDHSLPDLPAQLATGRYFIFHTTTDGEIFGTGPFQISDWSAVATSKVILTANESCWAGRPFVDKIELTMGVSYDQLANAVAFGQADVVDLPASGVRRAGQRGVRTVSSDPVKLIALQIDPARAGVQDARLRQAISLAIDRASIANVILQGQGIAAGGLLPNWISGYAHLFPISFDPAHAKELLSATGREVSHPAPLVLVYDSDDAEARAVAERVAVNLREIGIVAQLSGRAAGVKNSTADVRLVRIRTDAPDPGIALAGVLNALGEPSSNMDTPEQTYAAERAPIDAFRVIPLVHVSESYGLSPQVRDWMPPRWSGWRLEDVWLGPPSPGGGPAQ